MISNLSLSAFSATTIRPAEPRTRSAPVDAPTQVDRVRAQVETRAPQGLSSVERTPGPNIPGKPVPRGSLLDLSV